MKPILFNTEMVRAIIRGKKTQTRRIIKPQYAERNGEKIPLDIFAKEFDLSPFAPHRIGSILYVRETWRYLNYRLPQLSGFEYAADWAPEYFENSRNPNCCDNGKWRPSIHMPKKAARIFLRITGVRAERLQNIDVVSCVKEGVDTGVAWTVDARPNFIKLWDSTIKKADFDEYGWNANPWVFVYEFEQIRE